MNFVKAIHETSSSSQDVIESTIETYNVINPSFPTLHNVTVTFNSLV